MYSRRYPEENLEVKRFADDGTSGVAGGSGVVDPAPAPEPSSAGDVVVVDDANDEGGSVDVPLATNETPSGASANSGSAASGGDADDGSKSGGAADDASDGIADMAAAMADVSLDSDHSTSTPTDDGGRSGDGSGAESLVAA